MRKILLILVMICMCGIANAQCVAEVKDVIIDEVRGSIIVETQYKLNGVVVDVKANPDANAIGRTNICTSITFDAFFFNKYRLYIAIQTTFCFFKCGIKIKT